MSPPTKGPVEDPNQGSVAPLSPITQTYTKSLIQRLERRVQEEIELSALADLQWELKIIQEAQAKFLNVEKMFGAHFHMLS